MRPRALVLATLKRLEPELDPHGGFGQFDMLLHKHCDADVELIAACKYVVALRMNNLSPREWVRAAIADLEKKP
jgi:hypothetical protein